MARRTTHSEGTLPPALADFDSLPGSALIDVRVYARLMSCSPETVWRRAREGLLPPPIRVSSQQTRWRVGDVRKALDALGGAHVCQSPGRSA